MSIDQVQPESYPSRPVFPAVPGSGHALPRLVGGPGEQAEVAELPPLAKVADMPWALRRTARFVRARYRRLYRLPVLQEADGSRRFHDGLLFRREGLNVLFLRGDSVEMAFQHGRLLADEIRQGAPRQSAQMVGNSVANAVGRRGLFQHLLTEGIHRLITNTMLNYSIETVRRRLGETASLHEAVAIADATGIPVVELIRGLFNPEVMLILAKLSDDARSLRLKQFAAAAQALCCCSSFAAWGDCTSDGELLIGRNMDFPLNGYYDRFPTVIYYEPADGALRYMTFVSAGVHNAGLTAYNEAGIFLSSHTVPTVDVAVRGVPALITATQVIRRAHTFDEAAALFRQLAPPTGWGYFLASTRERRIGSIEISNNHCAIRPSNGQFHVQTNHFRTPEMDTRHLFLNTSVDEDIEGRFSRITQRIEQSYGRLDADEAISILADQVDPLVQQVRGLGSTVSVHTTLTSLVLDPARRRVLVATGPAPAPHSAFVELPLVGSFDREDFARRPTLVRQDDSFRREHPEKFAALKLFIQAKIAYECDNDVQRAYQLLRDVVKQDASNPAYYFQLGIFALKCGRREAAIEAFDDVFTRPYLTDQLRRLTFYYRGRALAHGGHAAAALRDLSSVTSDPKTDPKLRSAADRAFWRTRILRRCPLSRQSLMIMMQQSDMLQY